MAFDINTISLTKKIRSGLGFALLILAFTSTLSYYSLYTLIEKSELVDHTHEVLNTLENIMLKVTDIESGVRGYIITGESQYIESYEQDKKKILEHYSHLKDLSSQNISHTSKLDSIEVLIKKRIDILDLVIRLHSNNQDHSLIYAFRDGKSVMDQLKRLALSFKTSEQAQLQERSSSLQSFSGITPIVIIFSSLISLIIAALSFYYINRDLDKKAKAQKELESLNQQLNEKNEIMTQNKNELFKRNYLLTGVMEINDLMRGEKEIGSLSLKIIKHICEFMKSQAGTIYIVGDDNNFHLVSSYGIQETDALTKLIRPGEGMVGQTAVDKEIKILEGLSSKHLKIESSLIAPDTFQTLIMPLHYNEQTVAVIEMASIYKFEDLDLEFIKALNDSISIVINRLNTEIKTLLLLKQTQMQSQELAHQQSELKQINEELVEQQNRLIASEEELRANEEELQEKNAELEEKANELEEQYEEVRLKNNELEEARDAIKLQMEQLQSVSKYKSEFLANMSHELRTPLNSILILSKILKDNNNKNLNPKQVEHAEVIEKSGNDLLRLINEILDLARIESGKIKLEPQYIKLMEIGVEKQFKEMASQKNIKFNIVYEKNLPEKIYTDRFRLEQILKNLLSNAFKFTEEKGEVRLEISVPDKKVKFLRPHLQNTPAISFSIKDTGIGIPRDKQEIIFEAFQQADTSTTRKFGGTGLGLSISRELAILLGGEIQLESTENVGSTFTLFLPVQYNTEVEAKNIEIVEEIHSQAALTNPVVPFLTKKTDVPQVKKKILLIDDDVYFRKIVEDYALAKNYEIFSAGNGEEGIEIANQIIPDAILLDIKLPGINGLEVMEKLKTMEHVKNIPVHLMSAMDKEDLGEGAKTHDFLSKPITLESLENAFNLISNEIKKNLQKVLIIEDNVTENDAIKELLSSQNIQAESVHDGNKALTILNQSHFDCVILDINLPDINGFDLIEKIKNNYLELPVIIYSGKDLSEKEEARLKKFTNTIIIKTEYSYTRLLEEIKLFLHNVHHNINHYKPTVPEYAHSEALLKDRKVLVVDDDIRNIYSLNNVLESEGMNIIVAYDGIQALQELKENEDVDIVLMDIMMPEMDGIEAIKRIRTNAKFKNLPIIALTAKAMKGDKEKCIEAGASDYISKPVDVDKLLSLMRVWIFDNANKSL